MQVEDAALGIPVESHDKLRVLEVCTLGGLAPCTLGHVDAVECADELLCELPPLFKRPSPALGGVGGKFNPYHVPHQRSSAVNFLGKHLLVEEHPLVHGIGRYGVGQVVDHDNVRPVLGGDVAHGIATMGYGCCFCYHNGCTRVIP